MTYEVILRNHSTAHTISADTFVHDKGGLTFFNGRDGDNAPVAVAFFPATDVEYVKEKNNE